MHVRGTLAEPTLAVAIVGARAATAEAVAAAARLAQGLAVRGATVISGGALGVDAAAHRGALAGGGATVVVLGSGVDVAYPTRNAPLFAEIVRRGGALVSTYPDGTPPRPGQFVARNGVIAALADAVVVVEAGARSGALYTAAAAAGLGRPVGAVGASPGARGLHAAGAGVIATVDDVVALAAGNARAPVAAPVDERARAVAGAIGRGATVDELVGRTGLPARPITCALFELEAAGWVIARPDGSYVTTAIAPLRAEC